LHLDDDRAAHLLQQGLRRVRHGVHLPLARHAALFDAGVTVEEAGPEDYDAPLAPLEAAAVARALPKRAREFAAGRAAARRALSRLGVAAFALRAGDDRAPVWPDGVVGALAHCDGFCGVAVAPRAYALGLGLDAEPELAVDEAVRDRVLTAREHAWLAQRSDGERGWLATLFFCAKECLYKAQYPIARRFLEFGDVELDIAVESGEFAARVGDERYRGRFGRVDGLVLAGLTIPTVRA
jgi:4'-phosphopantetheinyl transferase EntD